METPSFKEDHISQVPALQLLQNIGYTYLPPEEAYLARGRKSSNVILDTILEAQLKKINKISFRGSQHEFSNSNINNAVHALKDIPFDGLVRTNEKVFDLLTLGKSFEQTVEGDTKSYSINFIDWKNVGNNVFHVTEEFEVAKSGSTEHLRPDLVLFANGIPLAVVECKKTGLLDEAISQQIRNQQDWAIPKLFTYSQLLLAIDKNEAKYATAGTSLKFWTFWKEQHPDEAELETLVNTPLSEAKKKKLFSERFRYVRRYFDDLERQPRLVTEQDRAIFYLLRPERLIELTYKYTLFDAGEKKVARYQQYFAVKKTLDRVSKINSDSKRLGGVIWHTQGSGKSLTMVMLAKALVLEPGIDDAKVVVVTDRIDLDKQVHKTFLNCGKEVQKAQSGDHLISLIEESKEQIITTVIGKFTAALNKKNIQNKSANIFALVDESQRSQYGSMHIKMQQVFPNACYIGLTGTPLMKRDKNTAAKFGGLIDTYTIDQAVKDKAVVPLLYEGRHTIQEVQERPIDSWFDRVTAGLSTEQKKDLKKKFSNAGQLNKTDQRIYRIAFDISEHFRKTFKDTPFKGQLAAPDKATAIKFKRYLDEIGYVTSEVVMSAPDEREGYDDVQEETKAEVLAYYKKMVDKHGRPKPIENTGYPYAVTEAYLRSEDPEIIIVIDMLLVGFDAPKNTVLYLCRNFRDHGLLQAIARVNRLFEGKEHGLILDYYGILGNLDQALTEYNKAGLDDFAPEDLEGALTDIKKEVEKLPQRHSDLWDVFKAVKNRLDGEEFEQLLRDDSLRAEFYERLSEYARCLGTALGTYQFVIDTPENLQQRYRDDLKFFHNLKASVQRRYAEVIDYKEYEPRIKKLLDTYVTSDEIYKVTPLINIFNVAEREEAYGATQSDASKADTIANQTKRTITEKMEEDPAFYLPLSKMLDEVIADGKARRTSESARLAKAQAISDKVINRTDSDVPQSLKGRDVARAFYGVIQDGLSQVDSNGVNISEVAAELGLKVDEIILDNRIVDWVLNKDIKNRMKDKIEDELFDLNKNHGIKLSVEQIDNLLERCINIAEARYPA
jgi:type I restriction enzyme R subunit